MTEETPNIRIEVRAGIANQPAVGFTPNEPVEPFTVGRGGSWEVNAPGVADIHAYLYFDGETVFVSSANPQDPAWVNGQPVGADWQPVESGSEIMMGGASLWVVADLPRVPSPDPGVAPIRQRRPKKPPVPVQDEATVMRPVQGPGSVPGPAPLPPRAKPAKPKLKIRQSARENLTSDEEATRFAPIEAGKAPEPPAPPSAVPAGFAPPGVAGSVSTELPPMSQPVVAPPAPWQPPGVTAGPMPPSTAQPMPGPSGPPPPSALFGGQAPAPPPGATVTTQTKGKKKPLDVIKESWKTSSIPQKAILLMMPLAFVAMFVIFQDNEQETEAANPPRAAASVAASSPVATATADVPDAPAEPVVENAPDAGTTEDAPSSDDTKPKLAKGEKTLQREAADALASGSNTKALELYEKLAKENPGNETYAEAVRILRDRAAGGER